jgi:cytochrome c oxidase subunit 2
MINFFNDTILFNQQRGSFWMPPQASTTAAEVDFVFYFIYWISVFFFILIVGLMTSFIILYRKRKGHEAQDTPHHNTALELTWTFIPLVLVVLIFMFGFNTYMNMTTIPDNTMDIRIIGQKWQWYFQYPNGHLDEQLHIPIDTPVKLTITSEDVTHSVFIPAFRLKMDAVPGRYTYAWVKATETGEYPLYCAEYCGTSHSDMVTEVVVHEPGGYETWLEKASNLFNTMSPVEVGEYLVKRRCSQCHTIDGSANDGPSFLGIWQNERKFKDGTSAIADDNYIRESILEPAAKVVEGYDNIMPTFAGKLKNEEIDAIIDYMKTLKKDE